MKPAVGIAAALCIAVSAIGVAKFAPRVFNSPGVKAKDGSSLLANGDRIHPAGKLDIPLDGDLPLAMLTSLDKRRCYVVTGGFHNHGIAVVNLNDKTNDQFLATTKCTGGIVETANGTGYFTAGDLGLRSFTVTSNKDAWAPVDITLPKNTWLEGLAKLPNGNLVASDLNNDKLLCIDPKTKTIVWTANVGHKPNRVSVDASSQTIAVANWGGSSVSIVDFNGKEKMQIAVGSQPSELIFGSDGTLYVSNAGSNSISVVKDGAVQATVFTSVSDHDLVGSTPTGLALDQNTLYVANSGSNNIAQIDVTDPTKPKVVGFIPSGWYPSVVSVSPGNRVENRFLLIGTAKGMRAQSNYPGIYAQQTVSDDMRTHYDYLPNRLEGDVSVVDMPDAKTLAAYTETCKRNAEREVSPQMANQEKAMIPTLRKIKHVVYIIRENRTYDQVLGDLKGANGEPYICMYGEKITPNGHKIARQFKTFDNLYCDGEVSQDGHQWCCSSYCTDFTEKAWPSGYADRGQPDADESVTSSPGGYLWDNCKAHGLSYRSYGEFASFAANKASAPKFDGESGLEGHASEKWSLDNGRDKDRVDIFIEEMKQAEAKVEEEKQRRIALIASSPMPPTAKAEAIAKIKSDPATDSEWPNFMVMSLGEDHTSGRQAGAFTPFSKVASNDVGLGKLVEAVSKSKFWKDTAIFVIEDDAQDGPDHVDGHRTVGYVISPYINRGGVDHTMYSTASMVRTMELMLGLPPMSQHDQHAVSMVAAFSPVPNLGTFSHEEARIDLSARNPKEGTLAMQSSKLDFREYDRSDPDILNHILWADAKPGMPYPVAGHLSR